MERMYPSKHMTKTYYVYHDLTRTSVTFIVGPKCELVTQLISPSKEFLKIQYIQHQRSENYRITFKKSHSSKAFH